MTLQDRLHRAIMFSKVEFFDLYLAKIHSVQSLPPFGKTVLRSAHCVGSRCPPSSFLA